MESKIALFDMDNTLFDYEGQLRSDLAKLKSPEEVDPLNSEISIRQMTQYSWISERIDLIKGTPGWWENLPVYAPGLTLFELAEEIGFSNKILTKGPARRPLAWAEKVKAIHRQFGDEIPIDVVGQSKEGTYGRVLVDDFPEYISSWLKWRPRGLVIMPAHPHNLNFDHPNVIRYDDTNLGEVRTAMLAAFKRQSQQHWKDCL
ncbi:MAG: hypothetical protein KDA65_16435 [Planctomycetaceae bacterium]|nr:hypothetical protein [Planctomycetaceae bacterium]